VFTFLIPALALNEGLDSLSSLPSPSEAIKNSEKLAQVFGGKQPLIHIGRPGGAPAVIFNPVLAALQQNLGNLDQVEVSEDEASLAASYIRCAVKFHDNEKDRQDAIKDLVDGAIGGTGEWGIPVNMAPLSSIKPERIWWHDIFVMLALELKNSLGLGGDALSQAVVDYCKIVSRDQVISHFSHLESTLTFVCSTSPSGSTVISLVSSLVLQQIASKSPSLFVWDPST
jgi:hypothetical protein